MTLTRAQRAALERDLPLVIDLTMLPAPGTTRNAMRGEAKEKESVEPTATAGGRHSCTVPGHRCMVSPEPRAPWWRTERAYRRSGVEWFAKPPHPAERVGVVALWLGGLYLAGHVLAWWLR